MRFSRYEIKPEWHEQTHIFDPIKQVFFVEIADDGDGNAHSLRCAELLRRLELELGGKFELCFSQFEVAEARSA